MRGWGVAFCWWDIPGAVQILPYWFALFKPYALPVSPFAATPYVCNHQSPRLYVPVVKAGLNPAAELGYRRRHSCIHKAVLVPSIFKPYELLKQVSSHHRAPAIFCFFNHHFIRVKGCKKKMKCECFLFCKGFSILLYEKCNRCRPSVPHRAHHRCFYWKVLYNRFVYFHEKGILANLPVRISLYNDTAVRRSSCEGTIKSSLTGTSPSPISNGMSFSAATSFAADMAGLLSIQLQYFFHWVHFFLHTKKFVAIGIYGGDLISVSWSVFPRGPAVDLPVVHLKKGDTLLEYTNS